MNFQNFHRNELSLTRSSPQDSKVGVCNTASKVSVFGDIQSECRKMRTRITPNTDTFHAVIILLFFINFIRVFWQKIACWGVVVFLYRCGFCFHTACFFLFILAFLGTFLCTFTFSIISFIQDLKIS